MAPLKKYKNTSANREKWLQHDSYQTAASYNRIVTRSQTPFIRLKNTPSDLELFADSSRHQPPHMPHLMERLKGEYGSIPRTIITRSYGKHIGIDDNHCRNIDEYKHSKPRSKAYDNVINEFKEKTKKKKIVENLKRSQDTKNIPNQTREDEKEEQVKEKLTSEQAKKEEEKKKLEAEAAKRKEKEAEEVERKRKEAEEVERKRKEDEEKERKRKEDEEKERKRKEDEEKESENMKADDEEKESESEEDESKQKRGKSGSLFGTGINIGGLGGASLDIKSKREE